MGEFYGHTAHELDKTIRKTIGMEQVAVEKHFTEFLHNHPKLTYKQVQFMNMLKNYIAQHGEIEIATLYEAPFTSVSHEGLDGVFTTEDADKLVLLLQPFYATKQEQNI